MKKFILPLFIALSSNANADWSGRARDFDGFGTIGSLIVLGAVLYGAYKALVHLVGEAVANAISVGLLLSFIFGIVPLVAVSFASLIFDFENLATVLGYTGLVWCIGCVIYQVRANWPEIVQERSKRKSSVSG